MKKFECRRCAKTCTLLLDENLAIPRCCIYGNRESLWCAIKEDSAEIAQTTVKSEQLPKLTVEVFDHPDCPEWANYAAVNKSGRVIFYEDKKSPGVKADIGFFDASDWPNTIIKRPKKQDNKLPDWVKVGETYYDYGARHYFKVTGIDDEKSEVSISWKPNMLAEVISYSIFKEFARPARKRQFNEKEMQELVGKIITITYGDRIRAMSDEKLAELFVYTKYYGASPHWFSTIFPNYDEHHYLFNSKQEAIEATLEELKKEVKDE